MDKQLVKSLVVRVAFLALLILLTLYLPGCGEKDPFPVFPAPEITGFTPPTGRVGSENLEITVSGTGFNETSTLTFNGSELSTTFIDEGELRTRVPHSLMSAAGSARVLVKNHPIAGGDSKARFFQITNYQFSPPVNVSSTPAGISMTPSIGVDPVGTIHLVWEENSVILYSRSTDDGANFSPSPGQPLSPMVASEAPEIFVDELGIIHVVWSDNWDIFYSRSENGGMSFSDGLNLSNTVQVGLSGFSATPSITVDKNGKVHVVWEEDFTIFYSSSTNGLSFTAGQSLLSPSGVSSSPSIAAGILNDIHVVWNEDGFIYHAFSTDGGGSFSSGQIISDPAYVAETPKVIVDTLGGVQAVWEEEGLILQGVSFDGGETFLPGLVLSDVNLDSASPVISADGWGNIHVMWDELDPTFTYIIIQHSLSADGGDSFTRGRDVSGATSLSLDSTLATDNSGNVFSAWWGDPLDTSEILFSKGE